MWSYIQSKADQTQTPVGFIGVVWDPWIWLLVKHGANKHVYGDKTGLSISHKAY